MNIAILTGGDSSEYGVSVKSAAEIRNWLDKAGYTTYIVTVNGQEWAVESESVKIPVDLNDFSFQNDRQKVKLDYAWNIIHGSPGENGPIQGYLDMKKIPYNTAGLLSSALTFNKHVCKTYLKQFGILSAESRLISRGKPYDMDEIIEAVGLPCFVKPNKGGSSFGITKVTQPENMKKAIEAAFTEDSDVIIETFIKGTEVTCGLVKTGSEELIFPLTEIVSGNEFFDFEAKYTQGVADEITPARISDENMKKCKSLASRIYDYTLSRGIVRVDFIIKGNQFYFLELNSIPGMTRESIVPQQIRAMDMKEETVLRKVIEDTLGTD